jgi:hypothetical protein
LIDNFGPLNQQNTKREFNLFFRPGHYDLGYSWSDAEKQFFS